MQHSLLKIVQRIMGHSVNEFETYTFFSKTGYNIENYQKVSENVETFSSKLKYGTTYY